MIELSDAFLALLPDLATRLGVASLCGILLGLERERKDKPAGLRTVTLITVGAALYMQVSMLIPLTAGQPQGITQVDPSRIAAQVVSGIGFLGAGTIIQSRGSVHGLTTAAMIWVSAGIGLFVGAGFPLAGLGLTLFVLAMLLAMAPVRRWVSRRGRSETISFLMPSDTLTVARVHEQLRNFEITPEEIVLRRLDPDTLHVDARHHTTGDATTRLLDALARIEGVRGAPLPSDPSG